jgi:hypothetical protein
MKPRVLLLVLDVALFESAIPLNAQTHSGPNVYPNFKHDRSQPLRSIPPLIGQSGAPQTMPLHVWPSNESRNYEVDPVRQTEIGSALGASIVLNFDGIEDTGAMPPDPNGSVGSKQFVQWVNDAFGVFDKRTGALVHGLTGAAILWSGFGGPCEIENRGDPIVVYDKAAGRWVMTQIAGSGPDYQCIAVSTSSDATGSYNRYAFTFAGQLVDFTKIGVWPDAYYMTFNRGQQDVCALDRSKMLAGQNASIQCFSSNHSGYPLLPADLDGSTPPPIGSPNYILQADVNGTTLNLWKFHVDFATPTNSTLIGPIAISVAPFSTICATCVPQLGTSLLLDGTLGLLTHRLAYRNFGAFESLLTDHAVANGLGQGSIRWYELRNLSGNPPTVYQQSTYVPDSLYRWMSSIAMDRVGDIALGYSVSSANMNPGIRFTGRMPSDPLGTLDSEVTIIDGTGSQTGSQRWGDYSSMSIDPVDDCTFWYTMEYLQQNGQSWHTRIASVRFPSCAAATNTALTSSLNPSIYGQKVTWTATVTSSGSIKPTGRVNFTWDGYSIGSATLNASGVATLTKSNLNADPYPLTAVYSGDANNLRSTSAIVNQVVKETTSAAKITSTPNPSTPGQAVTFTATITSPTVIPTGPVTFMVGTKVLGTAQLSSGKAKFTTSTLPVGSTQVTAVYYGDSNIAKSSASVIQIVH